MLHPVEIEVEFGDGRLSCKGAVITGDDTNPVSVDDEGVIRSESADLILVVTSDGELYADGEAHALDEGDYLLNGRGLWQRIYTP